MKMCLVLVTTAIVAGSAAPASAGTEPSLLAAPAYVMAQAAPQQQTDWAKYCRTIRNRPHRQQCQQEHNIPYSK